MMLCIREMPPDMMYGAPREFAHPAHTHQFLKNTTQTRAHSSTHPLSGTGQKIHRRSAGGACIWRAHCASSSRCVNYGCVQMFSVDSFPGIAMPSVSVFLLLCFLVVAFLHFFFHPVKTSSQVRRRSGCTNICHLLPSAGWVVGGSERVHSSTQQYEVPRFAAASGCLHGFGETDGRTRFNLPAVHFSLFSTANH